jgi:hypothetical protein
MGGVDNFWLMTKWKGGLFRKENHFGKESYKLNMRGRDLVSGFFRRYREQVTHYGGRTSSRWE